MDIGSFLSAASGVCSSVFQAIPFSGPTWFVLFVLSFFVWLFTKAHRNPESDFDWEDLFIDPDTKQTSPYRLGYMVGMIVGTWVIVHFADANKLSWDIFGGYLAYLLGGAGWAAAQAKAKPAPTPTPTPTPTPDETVK